MGISGARASSDGLMTARRPPVMPALIGVVALTVVAGVGLVMYSRASTPGYAVTVPDSAYASPRDAVYLSPAGDDAADGRLGTPVKTLARAVALAPDGGTLVLRGGIYFDGVTAPVARNLTLQPYPHETVWLDGAADAAGTKPWRARALAFGGGYGATVRGLGFRHYAACTTPAADGLPCAAVAAGEPNLVAVNNVFAETTGPALATAKPSGAIIRDNRFWRSSFTAISGSGDPAPEVSGNMALPD